MPAPTPTELLAGQIADIKREVVDLRKDAIDRLDSIRDTFDSKLDLVDDKVRTELVDLRREVASGKETLMMELTSLKDKHART
jgi:hypothetical protein